MPKGRKHKQLIIKEVELLLYDERVRLSNRVKAIRKERKITQKELSYFTGATINSISRIERMQGEPSLFTIARIAWYSDKQFKDLFG